MLEDLMTLGSEKNKVRGENGDIQEKEEKYIPKMFSEDGSIISRPIGISVTVGYFNVSSATKRHLSFQHTRLHLCSYHRKEFTATQ